MFLYIYFLYALVFQTGLELKLNKSSFSWFHGFRYIVYLLPDYKPH